jgi:hypothetical protein
MEVKGMNLTSDEYFNRIMKARRRIGIRAKDEKKARQDLETKIRTAIDDFKEQGYEADFFSQALNPENIDRMTALEPEKYPVLRRIQESES